MNDNLNPRHDRVPESWWDERSEAFEAWADSVSPADLEPADTTALQAITRLTDVRKEIDAAILEAVREARRHCRTWAEIGAMLGVTKQAAQHKYGPIPADSQPRSKPKVGALHEEHHRLDASSRVRTRPHLVAHADWSTNPRKRWHSVAVLEDDGCYRVSAPAPVGPLSTYLGRLCECAGPGSTVLTGFDFPIGLPASYAAMAGITGFRSALPRLGRNEWSDFYEPARSRSDISVGRPFYPSGPGKRGEHSQDHLYSRLGLSSMSDLKRRCERRAQSLFWLIGPNQVGKAAISGWRELLAPALASAAPPLIWPFDGRLCDLLARPGTVVAETYPAEMCRHLELAVSEPDRSKQRQCDRAADASALRAWARTNGVRLTERLRDEIEDGFGPTDDGEDRFGEDRFGEDRFGGDRFGGDRFDAVVGLFGMLDVVLGNLESGEPRDDRTLVEGWILGYSVASGGGC